MHGAFADACLHRTNLSKLIFFLNNRAVHMLVNDCNLFVLCLYYMSEFYFIIHDDLTIVYC